MKPSFVVLAFCLAALPVASHADPVPMSAGHLPMPREGTQVGILRENLSIDVRFDAMAVVAKLVLENRGAATTLPVGFPCYTHLDEDVVGLRCETELRVEVKGEPLKPEKQPTSEDEHHWLWSIDFAPEERIEVVVRYTEPMVNERYSLPIKGMGALTYRLSTGAAWDGPIGTLDMRISLPVETITFIAPAGYEREAGFITWKLRDFEPTGDLVVTLAPYETTTYVEAFGAKTYEIYQRNKEAGAYDGARISQLAQRFEARPAQLYSALSFWFGVVPLLRDMPLPNRGRVFVCIADSMFIMSDIAHRAKSVDVSSIRTAPSPEQPAGASKTPRGEGHEKLHGAVASERGYRSGRRVPVLEPRPVPVGGGGKALRPDARKEESG